MDEFWKDISLSPSHHQPNSAATMTATAVAVSAAAYDDFSHTTIIQEFLALPPPHTSSPAQQHGPPPPNALSFCRLPPAADVNSPPPLLSPNRKGGPKSDGGDRKHGRLMKNRESAARSRARKQAYTNELEMKVAHLKKENARLRRQKEKMRIVVGAMPSNKNKLYRTLTAPF